MRGGQLMPQGQVAQNRIEAVGAIPGVAEPGPPQCRPGAPAEQRADPLKVSQQSTARMRDPGRAA